MPHTLMQFYAKFRPHRRRRRRPPRLPPRYFKISSLSHSIELGCRESGSSIPFARPQNHPAQAAGSHLPFWARFPGGEQQFFSMQPFYPVVLPLFLFGKYAVVPFLVLMYEVFVL